MRISGAPSVIDGRLDEPVWSQAPVATGFTQSRPRPAAPASLRSEARVLVDGEAIYVGLTYFDPEPVKILTPLARRDAALSTGWLRGGPALRLPPRTALALSLATDQRKASYGTLDASAAQEPASGSRSLRVTPLVNLRISEKLQGSVGTTWESDTVGWQPVERLDGPTGPESVIGRVRQKTLSLTFRADLTLSPRLALQAYLQPFSSVGRYDDFQRLASPRDPDPGRRFTSLGPGVAVAAPDASRRSLNGDLVLRWEYHPGSFLTVVWNHQRDTLSQGTRDSARSTAESGLTRLFGDPPVNVLLVKVSRRFGA